MANERRTLLSSQALIQVPWIKVTIGDYEFGVFSKSEANTQNSAGFYSAYGLHYPNYIQSLQISKVNGQVNQYTLNISYPVKPTDDPNFFEKVFSSVSSSRKIIFSYGDAAMPTYCYKSEEAIITKIQTGFNFGSGGQMGSVITYVVSAVSTATLGKIGSFSFINSGKKKPSDEIKSVFRNADYGLQNLFTGMNDKNLDELIRGDDQAVELNSKINISPLDYITYLVGCMVPSSSTTNTTSKDIYLLTINDDTVYDKLYKDTTVADGPYFEVIKTSYTKSQSDAYEIDIGFNTKTIVTDFRITNNENYSLYYEYANEQYPEQYSQKIANNGKYEDTYAPAVTSKNDTHKTLAEDVIWYTKLTQYPISASITIQGLLRPAQLMQYIRINVIFPGGIGDVGERKHISSGLYIVTKQNDTISEQGYRTTLELTKISGDNIDGN